MNRSTKWCVLHTTVLYNVLYTAKFQAFQPNVDKPCQHMRAAFSIAGEEKFDPAMERLARLIREETELQKS